MTKPSNIVNPFRKTPRLMPPLYKRKKEHRIYHVTLEDQNVTRGVHIRKKNQENNREH